MEFTDEELLALLAPGADPDPPRPRRRDQGALAKRKTSSAAYRGISTKTNCSGPDADFECYYPEHGTNCDENNPELCDMRGIRLQNKYQPGELPKYMRAKGNYNRNDNPFAKGSRALSGDLAKAKLLLNKARTHIGTALSFRQKYSPLALEQDGAIQISEPAGCVPRWNFLVHQVIEGAQTRYGMHWNSCKQQYMLTGTEIVRTANADAQLAASGMTWNNVMRYFSSGEAHARMAREYAAGAVDLVMSAVKASLRSARRNLVGSENDLRAVVQWIFVSEPFTRMFTPGDLQLLNRAAELKLFSMFVAPDPAYCSLNDQWYNWSIAVMEEGKLYPVNELDRALLALETGKAARSTVADMVVDPSLPGARYHVIRLILATLRLLNFAPAVTGADDDATAITIASSW